MPIGLTCEGLAQRAGVRSGARVRDWERGAHAPQARYVPRLAAALGVDPVDLYDIDPGRPPLRVLRLTRGLSLQGTAVCEALASGTPVVGMARGCLPSLVEPRVTGFLADDDVEFTEALGRLDELDPEACAVVARRRFSPTVMADGYETLYAEVLRRQGLIPRALERVALKP